MINPNKPIIILKNGPLKCGKDDAISMLTERGVPLERAECKTRLHEMVMNIFDVSETIYWDLCNNRDTKEVPQSVYTITDSAMYRLAAVLPRLREKLLSCESTYQLTPREAMIYVSECIAKPTFGKDYFGKYRLKGMVDNDTLYVDGSAAFVEELSPLIDLCGQSNILLLRIKGRGSFGDNDSRDYIPDGILENTVDIWNTGTLEEYFHKVYETVDKFLE